jgi:tetratricopeptide (TPR) repeat protein
MKKFKILSLALALVLCAGFSFAQESLDAAKKLTTSEQYTQAADMFKKLISATPNSGDLYYYSGENELKAFFSDTITRSLSETQANCKKLFQKGIENDAANPLNYIGLARLDYIAGRKSGVEENVAKVNTMIPPMTLKIKKIEDPKRYALILNEMSKIYIVIGNTDTAKALPLLKRALTADGKNAEIHINMGDAFLNVKDVNAAIAKYNEAQAVDPKSPLAKLRIGYLYLRAKNLSAAIPFFEEALKIDPNFAPAYKELGFLYSRSGRQEQSKTNYLKYLELSGNNIPAKISYVIALFKSADYKECINQINQIFAVDSTINSLNRVMAYSQYEDKQYKKALYYIEKYIAGTGGDANKIIAKDYVYYGRALGELGKADLAEEKLRTAIAMDPTMLDLYSDIATYQNKVKNYKKACIALEDKIKANNAKVADYYNLGKYYFSDGNYGKSDTTFITLFNLTDPKVKSYEMLSLMYQGYARMNIDTTYQTGLAKPVYEKMIEKAQLDSAKYSKYLVDGYSYLGTYFLLNKTEKDYGKSKKYYLKVTAIDPKNERALLALKTKELSTAKLPD